MISISPPIYILHGWALHREQQERWQSLRDQISKIGFKTILLQIPGLSAPLTQVWKLDDYAHWLGSQLPKEPVILLGHSFGGQLAIRFSALYPQKVKQLILIDASGRRPTDLFSRAKRTVFYYLAKIGKSFTKSDKWRAYLYRLAREKDYQQAPPLLRQTLSNVLSDEIVDDLAKIVQPTLIVWGEEDCVTPISQGRLFANCIAQAKFVSIKTARHSPHFTHVDEVASSIKDFLLGGQ